MTREERIEAVARAIKTTTEEIVRKWVEGDRREPINNDYLSEAKAAIAVYEKSSPSVEDVAGIIGEELGLVWSTLHTDDPVLDTAMKIHNLMTKGK